MAFSDLSRHWWEEPAANFTHTTGRAFHIYTCDWGDKVTSRDQLFGRTHSDYAELVCTEISIVKLGNVDQVNAGPKAAKITATFEPLSVAAGKRVISDWAQWRERWEIGGESITITPGFKWSDADVLANCSMVEAHDASAAMVFPEVTISIMGLSSDVDATSKGKLLAAEGKINNAAFIIKGVTFGKGTLLFLGAILDEGEMAGNQDVYQVTETFAYKANTWNRFWRKDRAGSPGWQKMIGVKNAANTPFSDISFTDNVNPTQW